MYLKSKIALAITKEKVVYNFEPNLVVEVPDNIGEIILSNAYNQNFISKVDAEEGKKEVPELKVIQDPPLESKPEDEKKDEVKPLFTEEELSKMTNEDLVGLGKEMGIQGVNIGWKRETLIKKVLEVKPDTIE